MFPLQWKTLAELCATRSAPFAGSRDKSVFPLTAYGPQESRKRTASEFVVPTKQPEPHFKRPRVDAPPSLQRQGTSQLQIELGYKPLGKGQFRLVELKAGAGNADIVCELRVWNESIEYEAVSYIRNQSAEGVSIMMRAEKRQLPKPVMPNLHAALKHLRLQDRSRYLWINALCIDHGNVKERSDHVHLLHEIFNRATNVCLWLGELDGLTSGTTSQALHFAKQILAPQFFDDAAKDIRLVPQWKALLDLITHPLFERRWVVQEVAVAGQATLHYGHTTMNWDDFADVVTMFEHAENRNSAISNLFKKTPGFEYHPDIIGDVQALGASRFINLTSNIFKSKTQSKTGDVAKSLLSLEDLVFQLASFKGWDPRDVIFACVSVSKESQDTGFAPSEQPPKFLRAADKFLSLRRRKAVHCESSDLDAEREIDSFLSRGLRDRTPYDVNYDVPVLSTYKEFIAHVLRKGRSLGILCRPWAPPKEVLAIHMVGDPPSWIATLDRAAFGKSPRFASYVRINADPLIGSPGKEPYRASLDLPASWRFPDPADPNLDPDTDRLLHVDGFVLTTISETRTEAVGGNIPLKWLQFAGWNRRDEGSNDDSLSGLRTQAKSKQGPPTKEQLPPESLWRTLVADRGPNGSPAPVFYRRACHYAFKQTGIASAIDTEELLDNISLSMVKEFLQRVQEAVWNRQLIKTKRGHLGLAPDTAEKTDLICILYGCSVPVVIREVDGGKHELIGECYIDGMMDGAALAVQTSEKIAKMTFKLQ
ncbi:HET-domain-containing protein [Venturia nashicola]|uniref:HET-domain-containing protein n=1 Tax=Venturia nashicola TaxID=86259 RepID=A0A4Z1NG77_9PEZI|nr:HET-domain-containing protein [Venturia nashicola]